MASISYKTLQLMETGHHDWRLSSLKKIARALKFPPKGIEQVITNYFRHHHDSIEAISLRIAEEGEASWKYWLFEFVDTFRHDQDISLIETPPRPGISLRIRALLASTVESLCLENGLTIPWWCDGVQTLSTPWFVSESENLKAMALIESPLPFRKRNIFVLNNFLSRA